MMNKKNTAGLVSKFEDRLRCPICQSQMQVVDLKSIICTKNHTFDFAKQGYVNMLNRADKSQYDKDLFVARHDIIIESNLYDVMHERISVAMKENMRKPNKDMLILDAGSGEGSHLQRILEKCETERLTGIGIDISKEGIRLAASNYKAAIWIVGDLANTPIKSHSLQGILNILSPANYQEFKRILSPDGIMIKVVPGPDYLKELRALLFDDTDKSSYENDETVSLFKEHFQSVNIENLKFKQQLSQKELKNLIRMSPLTWNAELEDILKLESRDTFEITIDLDVLIGIKD